MDKIDNIGLTRMLTQSYDFEGFTTQEVWSRIAQRMNIIIEHFKYLDSKFNNQKEIVDKKLDYLLNEGLTEQVARQILLRMEDGTIEELINTNVFNSLNTTIENNKLDIEGKLNIYKEENNNELNNINDELNNTKLKVNNNENSIISLNEKYNTNKLEIDNNLNKINTINNNLSNYMLKSDLITETGSITLGDNIKIATDTEGKQLFTLEKNKEGLVIGNITVSTVNKANDITHGKLLFTLNENYRPSHQIIIPCYCSRSSQPDKIIGAISIYKDGRVLINLFEKSPEEEIYPVESVYINFFIKVS